MRYEYGIIHKSLAKTIKSEFDKVHIKTDRLQVAEEWIEDWVQFGGELDEYIIIRRVISDWEVFE